MDVIKIVPAGDRALLVRLEQVIREDVNDKVRGLMSSIEKAQIAGVGEMVPTYCSLLVYYDPERLGFSELKDRILKIYGTVSTEGGSKKRILEVPCCYGSHFGPDLADMEKITGLSREEIVSIHSNTAYRIYMLGFLPGYVYLGGMDKRLEAPRLSTPRLKIPAGSVAIGGAQTGVYPMVSPGGWRIIGGTPVDFFDPDREEPVLCRAGEYIRFYPVSVCEYYDIRQDMQKGRFELKITEE